MNKIKMGQFLKDLRLNYQPKLSLEDLADKFGEDNFTVSANAISRWERGLAIPDIDKLNFLAAFYNVTIDEILDGEKEDKIDYNTKYFIHRSDWINSFISINDPTLQSIYL